MKTIKLLALLFISSLVFTGCSDEDDHHDDDHDHDHEEEVITTLNYTLTNGDDVITFTYKDLDGDGGQDAEATVSGNLLANTEYTASIELLNETEDPADDITAEVAGEAEEHEFFFATSENITIVKNDTDEDGNPLGLISTLTTGDAGTGSFTIILKHEPTKPNDGTSSDAGGSTDIEATYTFEIE